MTTILFLTACLILLVAACAGHTPSRRPATTRRRPTTATNRRRNDRRPTRTRAAVQPGLVRGTLVTTRNTRCSLCHGPVLKGERVYRTRNGVVGPCCGLR